ncbi:MAG: hypothetical protein ACYC2O_07045 [Microthrixaceae bacterium]
MILKWLLARALGKIFGDGFAADLAGRGVVYLADGVRTSLQRDDEDVTRVRLRAGERYTVVARPAATRHERKLAAQQRALANSYDHLARPHRRQRRAARRLAKAQRRLARTTPGTARHERRSRTEQQLGVAFDRAMRPGRKQLKVATALTTVTRELESSRAESLAQARVRGGLRRRRTRVRVYD